MSHLSLSLMERLNTTKFAVFIFWMVYFKRIPLSDNLHSWLKLDDCLWLDPPWFNKCFSLALAHSVFI